MRVPGMTDIHGHTGAYCNFTMTTPIIVALHRL